MAETMKEQNSLILTKLIDLSEKVEGMNRTLNNGLSHKTEETHAMGMALAKDFAEYKTTGRLIGCPYVVDKERRANHRSHSWKRIVAFVSLFGGLGGAIATWLTLSKNVKL